MATVGSSPMRSQSIAWTTSPSWLAVVPPTGQPLPMTWARRSHDTSVPLEAATSVVTHDGCTAQLAAHPLLGNRDRAGASRGATSLAAESFSSPSRCTDGCAAAEGKSRELPGRTTFPAARPCVETCMRFMRSRVPSTIWATSHPETASQRWRTFAPICTRSGPAMSRIGRWCRHSSQRCALAI